MIDRLGALLDVLYPARCVACDATGREPFCSVCRHHVDPGGPLPLPAADWSWAEFEYGGAVRVAIQRMKYERRPEIARPLGACLERSVGRFEVSFDLVVPIPTAPARLRQRGYNPARELARAWRGARCASIGRRASGPGQVGRSRADRRSSLRGVFSIAPDRVRDRRILVIDDVFTTGATASAFVERVRRAGARWVGFAALARTP